MDYKGNVSTPAAELATVKIVANSIISTPKARGMCADIENFYQQVWDDVKVCVELDVEEKTKGHDEEVQFLIKEHIYEKRD